MFEEAKAKMRFAGDGKKKEFRAFWTERQYLLIESDQDP